jgi:hypothetical protein
MLCRRDTISFERILGKALRIKVRDRGLYSTHYLLFFPAAGWECLWHFPYVEHITTNGRLTDEEWIGKYLEGNVRELMKLLSQKLLAGTEKAMKYVKWAGESVDVETEDFPNTNLKHCL